MIYKFVTERVTVDLVCRLEASCQQSLRCLSYDVYVEKSFAGALVWGTTTVGHWAKWVQ